MALLSGKATVAQLARRYGVLEPTIEGWRDQALAAMDEALRGGEGPPGRQHELERENVELREALAEVSRERQFYKAGYEEWKRTARPSRPVRSRR